MKSSAQNKTKKINSTYSAKSSIKKNTRTELIPKKKRNSLLYGLGHSLKRYIKNLARKILLSKGFHTFFKVVVGVLLFSSLLYGFYTYFNRSLANGVVVSKSEIIGRVAKLTALPTGVPDAIVRVEDPEALKKQNIFYENVKSGDYIIMYPGLAVIYDLRNNVIVAIKKQ